MDWKQPWYRNWHLPWADGSWILSGPKSISPASISGTPQFNEVLTATPGVWEDAETVTGQWYLGGIAIPGETNLTLTVPFRIWKDEEIYYLETAVNNNGKKSKKSNSLLAEIPITHHTALGTSTTALTSRYNSSFTWLYYGESYLQSANHLVGTGLAYVADGLSSPVAGQHHFGVSGSSTATQISNGMAQRAIDACVACPGNALLVLQVNRNDISTGEATATTLARLETLLNMAEASFVRVAVVLDAPRLYAESGPDERVILPLRNAYNAGAAAMCAPRKIPVIDWSILGEDPLNPGYMTVNLVDTLRPGHFKVKVGKQAGQIYSNVLKQHFNLPPRLNLWDYQANNLCPNFQFAVVGAARPTGWSGGNNAPATHTWTTVDYGDGTGRRWYRIFGLANGGTGSVQQTATSITTGFAEGSKVEVLIEMRFPDPSTWAGGAYSIWVFRNTNFTGPEDGRAGFALDSPPATIIRPDESMVEGGVIVLRSMPFILPAGTTSLTVRIQTWGSATYDLGTPTLLVDDVALPQNFTYVP
jgi:hypothetical protein